MHLECFRWLNSVAPEYTEELVPYVERAGEVRNLLAARRASVSSPPPVAGAQRTHKRNVRTGAARGGSRPCWRLEVLWCVYHGVFHPIPCGADNGVSHAIWWT